MRYLLNCLKSGMALNSAGGASWALDDWTRLRRFLILGSEGGSYYACERALTMQNALATQRCLESDGPRAVKEIVAVSESGRAPSNDPAIFALALASAVPAAAPEAMKAIPRVCRTGSHLFSFVKAARACRGMGRSLRRGIADWYGGQDTDKLAYQLLKYRRRGRLTHRDVLRLCHAVAPTPAHDALFRYTVGAPPGPRQVIRDKHQRDYAPVEGLPSLVEAFERLQMAGTAQEAIRQLEDSPNLSWEMLPSRLLGENQIWETLLPNLPMMALLRNLGRLTANGTLDWRNQNVQRACERLTNPQALAGARIHPLSVLTALEAYRRGFSRGGLVWTANPAIVRALDQAFYLAFGHLRPSAKRTLLALDVSASMTCPIKSLSAVSCRVAAAAMAMATARVEPSYQITAFCDQIVPISIRPNQTLGQIVAETSALRFGATDCAAPMLWAMKNKLEIDTFVVYTDSETWAGGASPCRALRQYRDKTGIPAQLIVVGMVSNGFSIADPTDAGMLDVVGFDTSAPEMISAFARGEI